ncbi:uncharacterized protein MONOS_774 [Monocercomonoides exilis]|uniref:uncharacterized protein n=1 Tax=Monocercomonoides exilis TaxID=2049356 RepID=UPI003559F00D|nr:hypothetical protein MONOS_774 [Monocercomonoides exilis]|eukprot:MONOS_774.1-p1 / transcript=MONOS_774.1 / gene=MONOS_774 / organism=Monocercomonoides_exilis_PA203 / gene_product=unspecified product / transcript_product=unspecified product / location=Mono_scaffold00013:69662-70087(-) / protein_length=103 / sequence_SO=supercontig / SO=protein_coding / is_pseudo=false
MSDEWAPYKVLPDLGFRHKFLQDYLSTFIVKSVFKVDFVQIVGMIYQFEPLKIQEEDDTEDITSDVADLDDIIEDANSSSGETDSDSLGAGDGSSASSNTDN